MESELWKSDANWFADWFNSPAYHTLYGHRDEAETECVAMWAVGRTTVALGGSRAEGVDAANWYATNYNPLLRPDYHAPNCLQRTPPVSPIVG